MNNGFNVANGDTPYTISNRAKFTIGTGGFSNTIGTLLGISSLKPKKDISTVASQFVSSIGDIGCLSVVLKTTGEILITSDAGTAPGFLNIANSSYYATFDFEF